MPRAPLSACPTCRRLHREQRCPVCEPHWYGHRGQRPSAAARGYGRRWRVARLAFLKRHPHCVSCRANGRETAAAVVDHIRPHRGNMRKFWDTMNWQALCRSCHGRKTTTVDAPWTCRT